MQVAGLNHFIFVRQILHKGKEWLPEVIAEINAGRDPLVPRNIPPFRWPSHLLQGLGMIPCAYLRYYYMKDDLLRQELAEAGGEGTRGEVVKQLEKSCLTSTATRTWQSNRRRWKARRPVLFRGGLRADECHLQRQADYHARQYA